MNRIKKIFQNRSKKVIPYLTAGYPDKENTVGMVLAAESAGAAMVELGMPFSDPIADGPIIQESSQIAIEGGVTIEWILDTVKEIRKVSEIPIALMGYINPIINFGLDSFLSECNVAGVDGLIIPDLPLEEAQDYVELSKKSEICPILLIAPNSSQKRIKEISSMAGELVYCVAILGITGSSSADKDKLNFYMKNVSEYCNCPFVVGFGIKERSDIVEVNHIAHGAVVGSAIINELKKSDNPIETVRNYIDKLTK